MIAALHDLGGRPVHPLEFEPMVDRIRLPRAGTQRLIHQGSSALACIELPLHDAAKACPAVALDDEIRVFLDGVVDNRKELQQRLDLPQPTSDAHLIRLAYRRWGVDLGQRLIGEFACVLWDSAARRLVAIRDPLGVKELFYRLKDRRLRLASQMRQLLDQDEDPLSMMDQDYVADFVSAQVVVGNRTPFRDIHRLEAGSLLVAEAGKIQITKYWDLQQDLPTGCHSIEDYGTRFRDLFTRAVEACVSAPGCVWAELSGGLDSSSIVSVAQEVLPSKSPLSTVTLTWPETPDSDEGAWALHVVNALGLQGHQLPCDGRFFTDAEEGASYRNEPHFGILCHPFLKRQADFLFENGADTLLSGSRAEGVILDSFEPIHLADLLRTLRFRQLAGQLKAWQRASGDSLINLFVWSCLQPLFSRHLMDRSVDRRMRPPEWIDPEFRRRYRVQDRAKQGRGSRRFRNRGDQFQYEMIVRSEQLVHRGYLDWSTEVRYPFLNKSLVEFCFAVPWEIKHRPGEHKTLLRLGLQGLLPEQIRRRTSWTGPTTAAFKTLVRNPQVLDDLTSSSLLVELGVFDRDKWHHALRLAGLGQCANFVMLTSCMAFEYWLRSLATS